MDIVLKRGYRSQLDRDERGWKPKQLTRTSCKSIHIKGVCACAQATCCIAAYLRQPPIKMDLPMSDMPIQPDIGPFGDPVVADEENGFLTMFTMIVIGLTYTSDFMVHRFHTLRVDSEPSSVLHYIYLTRCLLTIIAPGAVVSEKGGRDREGGAAGGAADEVRSRAPEAQHPSSPAFPNEKSSY
ncbi:hypothetical protein EVAR_62734_1 [Eumeta japonica]|uniref:Uncharacterized protein n=1 Tax=Eumeta variegata TaxID=151549 RepID=A0A4C1ZYC5_EUMVA|nr:hypothetical protein EVAR_62734_1 [Eumeta japonica]